LTRTWLSAAAIVLLTGCGSSLWLHMCTAPENELRVQVASARETLPNPRFTIFDPNNPLSPRYDKVQVTGFKPYPEHSPTVWDTQCQRESCAGGDAAVFSYGENFAQFTDLTAPQPLQAGRKYVLEVSRRGRPRARGWLLFGVEADGSLREYQYRMEADGNWHMVQLPEK
jgi:hypothetical protein